MDHSENLGHEPMGLSAGQLILMFLAGVAVCAVFFSLGFLVGYNERHSQAAPVTEQVGAPSDIPPVISQEPATASAQSAATKTSDQPASSSGAHPEPLRPQPLASATSQDSQTKEKPKEKPTEKPAGGSALSSATPAKPAAASATSSPGADANAPFNIQVAASSTKQDADKIVTALKTLDYQVFVISPEQSHAEDHFFRVEVGPFSTRDVAERVRSKLIQDGFKQPFIKH